MEGPYYQNLEIPDSVIKSVAKKLAIFSSSFDLKEKYILNSIILERLDPLDRIKLKDIHQILTNEEITFLDSLLKEEVTK